MKMFIFRALRFDPRKLICMDFQSNRKKLLSGEGVGIISTYTESEVFRSSYKITTKTYKSKNVGKALPSMAA